MLLETGAGLGDQTADGVVEECIGGRIEVEDGTVVCDGKAVTFEDAHVPESVPATTPQLSVKVVEHDDGRGSVNDIRLPDNAQVLRDVTTPQMELGIAPQSMLLFTELYHKA